jgi:hypothetical protein
MNSGPEGTQRIGHALGAADDVDRSDCLAAFDLEEQEAKQVGITLHV